MLEPGDALDVWVVDRALGHGGMGSVYRCHNRNAPRILAAVKVLELPTRRHPEATARFIREAEILFGLNHPNIVKVRNIRTDHDPPYLEMEFVEGESLEDALQRGPIVPKEKAIDVIRQCAKAIHYLHKSGVRHRDIKPANFLLRHDGRVKLVDFGLALEQDVSRITQAGMAFGTVSYAPPEWANPEQLDPVKWDMYALGVVMYEVLTGEVAFPVSGQGSARQQAMQVVLSKQGHEPLDPGEGFPNGLRALIADLTASDASQRLSDSVEVLRRLGIAVSDPTLDGASEEDQPSVVTTIPTPGIPMPRARAPAPDTFPVDEQGAGPSSLPARRAPLLAGAALSLLGIGLGLAGVVVGAIAWVASGGDHRDVEVVVSGITADTPHQLRVNGREADRHAGLSYRFDALPLGPTTVSWVVGEGCTVAACEAGTCSPACGHGSRSFEVRAGEGRAKEVLEVPAPTPRAVRFPLPPLPKDVPVAVRVDGVPTSPSAGGVKSAPLLPGPHEAVLALGSCPPEVAPCDDDCPKGCLAVSADVTVPWTGAPSAPPWPDDLPERWAKATATSADPPPTPAPRPEPPPKPRAAAGKLVTQGQLAAWLQGEGQLYQPGAPKDYGNGHLAGWSGTTPPDPSAAVVGVSFPAARAYCASHGGLPTLDDGVPATARMEWRDRGDGKAAIVFQGDTTGQNTSGTGHLVGTTSFRCRR